MGMTATWWLGQEKPTVKGTHKPGVPQRWTITVMAEGNNNIRQRWLLRPKAKLTLDGLEEYISDELAQFKKENDGYRELTWTAISR